MYIQIHTSEHMYMYACVHAYINRDRERERDKHICIQRLLLEVRRQVVRLGRAAADDGRSFAVGLLS